MDGDSTGIPATIADDEHAIAHERGDLHPHTVTDDFGVQHTATVAHSHAIRTRIPNRYAERIFDALCIPDELRDTIRESADRYQHLAAATDRERDSYIRAYINALDYWDGNPFGDTDPSADSDRDEHPEQRDPR